MSAPTPGPWRLGQDGGTVVADHEDSPLSYPQVVEHYGARQLICESASTPNRILIAAAPDMLAALEKIAFDEDCEIMESIKTAKEAVAKAKGEA